MSSEGLMVFTGNANPKLAEAVVKHLGIPLGKALVGRFSDGEVQVEIQENVRGKHVFINGESFAVGRADKVVLDVLANERGLPGNLLDQASDDVLEALYTWYQDGWIELG